VGLVSFLIGRRWPLGRVPMEAGDSGKGLMAPPCHLGRVSCLIGRRWPLGRAPMTAGDSGNGVMAPLPFLLSPLTPRAGTNSGKGYMAPLVIWPSFPRKIQNEKVLPSEDDYWGLGSFPKGRRWPLGGYPWRLSTRGRAL